jgi:hypothetical protein
MYIKYQNVTRCSKRIVMCGAMIVLNLLDNIHGDPAKIIEKIGEILAIYGEFHDAVGKGH